MHSHTKKNKIIYIAPQVGFFRPEERNCENVYYYYHWGYHYSYGLMKTLSDLKFEIWKYDTYTHENCEKEIEELFLGRIFPATYLPKLIPFSWPLVKMLLKETKKNNIVIFFNGLHNLFHNFISLLFWYVPQVNVQIGGANPLWKFGKNKRLSSYIYGQIDRLFIRNHDYVFARTRTEGDYLSRSLKKEQIIWHPVKQIFFDKLPIISRAKARREIGWPDDKKILIVVGRAVSNVGTKTIIDFYDEIKKAGYDLIWVGLSQGDNGFLEQIQKLKIPSTSRIPYKDMYLYYNAADVYIYPSFDEETLKFGGTGSKSLEALCCGTPVVSTTMVHFPGEIDTDVCKIPAKPTDIIPAINSLFENYPERNRCRKMIEKYYQQGEIMKVQHTIFKQLFDKYYNIRLKELN